jgi:hypothetical protein
LDADPPAQGVNIAGRMTLTGKMAATGYTLPDIGLIEAAPDDDSDDDGEEA